MGKSAIILLADDNPDDVALMKRAIQRAGMSNRIHAVSNGAEAMEYLKGAIDAKSVGCSVPLLISLDLNMPVADGFEVLAWIKEQPELEHVPVLVLSQSERKRDINRASHLGANAYLVKPANFEGLVGIIEIFKQMIGDVERSTSSPRGRNKHSPRAR